jgi:hypothetical protein
MEAFIILESRAANARKLYDKGACINDVTQPRRLGRRRSLAL